MSDIKEKIKELERLQKKVDFLKQIIDFPKKLKAVDSDENVVLPEVCVLIEELVSPVIESLEKGTEIKVKEVSNEESQSSEFTQEEVKALKSLANRVLTKNEKQVPQEHTKPKVTGWVTENQHLGGKRVKTLYLSKDIEGEVISLQEPFIVIKLDNGKIHKATLDKITVI